MKTCDYEIAIAGGGVAGLSAAILLAQAGYKTILIEKHKYPFHRVCGEYISLESLPFLKLIGFDPDIYGLPYINKFKLSSGNSVLETKLPLGGLGVSRYFLDEKLMQIVQNNGATIRDNCTITNIIFNDNYFKIKTNEEEFSANIVLCALGKKSNITRDANKNIDHRNNYIGVKYHVKADLPVDQIELHIFKDGYCGISKVEGSDKYCMCYMTTAANLNKCGNNIAELETSVLCKNPFLNKYINEFEKITDLPVTISQITPGIKEIIYNNMMIIGDAAGTIAPLCGNGMSMAFQSAYAATHFIGQFFKGTISYPGALGKYQIYWKNNFYKRIYYGNYLHKLFLNEQSSSFAIRLLKSFPSVHAPLIRLTHGKNFIATNQSDIPVR